MSNITGDGWTVTHMNKSLTVRQVSVKVAGSNLASDPVFVGTWWQNRAVLRLAC